MVPSSRRSIDTTGSPNEIGRSGASLLAAGTEMLGFALISGGFHLCGLAIEERADTKFCLLVALRHGGHQRLHQEAGLRIGFRDHRQRLQHGKIRQRRIVRDLVASSTALASALPSSVRYCA